MEDPAREIALTANGAADPARVIVLTAIGAAGPVREIALTANGAAGPAREILPAADLGKECLQGVPARVPALAAGMAPFPDVWTAHP